MLIKSLQLRFIINRWIEMQTNKILVLLDLVTEAVQDKAEANTDNKSYPNFVKADELLREAYHLIGSAPKPYKE